MEAGRLLSQALASYPADGRAHTTLPLLTAAGNKLDAALLQPMLLKKLQLFGSAVDDNAVLVKDVMEGCGLDKWADKSDEPPSKRARQDTRSEAEIQASADKEHHREDVRCVFKQMAREWSTGKRESSATLTRGTCFHRQPRTESGGTCASSRGAAATLDPLPQRWVSRARSLLLG